jgi:hypothetical protein
MLTAANQPFSAWSKVFSDQAIDRPVHHATILEMNIESDRRRAALDRKPRLGRPPTPRQSRKPAAASGLDCRHSHPDCSLRA